jgi:hypothetical protein
LYVVINCTRLDHVTCTFAEHWHKNDTLSRLNDGTYVLPSSVLRLLFMNYMQTDADAAAAAAACEHRTIIGLLSSRRRRCCCSATYIRTECTDSQAIRLGFTITGCIRVLGSTHRGGRGRRTHSDSIGLVRQFRFRFGRAPFNIARALSLTMLYWLRACAINA